MTPAAGSANRVGRAAMRGRRLYALALLLAGTVVFAASGPTVRYVFRSELAALLAAVAAHAPADLPSDTAGAARWTEWVRARDAAVRARVVRAEEDALAYLLVYGTSFTKAPRITRAFIAEATQRASGDGTGPSGVERVVGGVIDARVSDLVIAARTPAGDERLAWVRGTFDRLGLRVDTPAGAGRARIPAGKLRARYAREPGAGRGAR